MVAEPRESLLGDFWYAFTFVKTQEIPIPSRVLLIQPQLQFEAYGMNSPNAFRALPSERPRGRAESAITSPSSEVPQQLQYIQNRRLSSAVLPNHYGKRVEMNVAIDKCPEPVSPKLFKHDLAPSMSANENRDYPTWDYTPLAWHSRCCNYRLRKNALARLKFG
jgi:hypothetical protein